MSWWDGTLRCLTSVLVLTSTNLLVYMLLVLPSVRTQTRTDFGPDPPFDGKRRLISVATPGVRWRGGSKFSKISFLNIMNCDGLIGVGTHYRMISDFLLLALPILDTSVRGRVSRLRLSSRLVAGRKSPLVRDQQPVVSNCLFIGASL